MSYNNSYAQSNPYAQDNPYQNDTVAQPPQTYNNGPGQPQPGYEMNAVNGSQVGKDDMNVFFAEVDDIRSSLDKFNQNIATVEELQSRSLNEIDEAHEAAIQRDIDAVTAETTALSQELKSRIKNLESRSQRDNTKRTQAANLKKKFMDSIQRYQSVEAKFRQQYRQRAERQYRIVRPDATDVEVQEAIEDASGGQIFSQALLQSNRRGEARTALSEVQNRHKEIQKIEKTMGELAQLFSDMEMMVQENEAAVTHIDERAGTAQHDIEQGVGHTNIAVRSARAARRKKWWCLGLCIIIIIVIVVVVVVPVEVTKNN